MWEEYFVYQSKRPKKRPTTMSNFSMNGRSLTLLSSWPCWQDEVGGNWQQLCYAPVCHGSHHLHCVIKLCPCRVPKPLLLLCVLLNLLAFSAFVSGILLPSCKEAVLRRAQSFSALLISVRRKMYHREDLHQDSFVVLFCRKIAKWTTWFR